MCFNHLKKVTAQGKMLILTQNCLSGRPAHQHTGRAIGQGPICDVWVTGDPTNVCSAPVHIIRVIIKHHLKGGRSVKHVATHCMQYTLVEWYKKRDRYIWDVYEKQISHSWRIGLFGASTLGFPVEPLV